MSKNQISIDQYIQKTPLPLLGLIGGIAASTAETLTFAFDNVKTRMQMNGKQGMPTYNSFTHCIQLTYQNRGIRGFYKGLSAALLRQMLYSSSRMLLYEKLKRIYFTQNPGYFLKLYCGGLSGAIACVIGTPADVLKIRLINDLNGVKYNGIIDCAKQTYLTDGIIGFFKGVNVNIARAIVVNATELATYDQSKEFLVKNIHFKSESLTTHFIASTMAGFIAAIFSSPVDVVKTRYMNQMTHKGMDVYKNGFDCFFQIFRKEGFFALYKGFISYFARIAPWNIFFFMSYEQYKAFVLPKVINL